MTLTCAECGYGTIIARDMAIHMISTRHGIEDIAVLEGLLDDPTLMLDLAGILEAMHDEHD